MSFRRYSEYKDSGVEWLGEVPVAWKIEPLLAVASERCQSNAGMVEDNRLSLSYGRIVQKDIDSNDGLLPESFETYQIVQPDDIVFRLTDLQNDQRSLRTALVTQRGIITSAYLAVSPRKAIVPRYLHYLLRACDEQKVFYSMGGGLRQSMKYADVKRLPLVAPPRDEQIAIATFLDHETAKIDALVTEQEKLIALLKEKRQGVISHAVTKGLDPDVPMKDSGIEWLGKVPAHWDVSALGYLATIETGATPDRDNPSFWEGTVPWVKTGEVNYLPIYETEECITDLGLKNSSTKIAEAGTLLMAMYGQGATRGRVAILRIAAAYNQACAAIVFGDRLSTEYGHYFFIAAYDFVRDFGNETSQMNLSSGIIRKIKLPIPPMTEQARIIALLDTQTTKIDALVAEAESAASLLKERRSALISAAVTGKIDVRDFAAERKAA